MASDLSFDEFLDVLASAREILIEEMRNRGFHSSSNFERAVRSAVSTVLHRMGSDLEVDFNPHAQAFPDICIGKYGIEVKHTENNTWRGVANSISQGMRNEDVEYIYVIWCKEGGSRPDIIYRPYEDVVMHVRTSHVPRFEIDMETEVSLFRKFRTSYKDFSSLSMEEKMDLVRSYARRRIINGVSTFFWFLESQVVDDPRSRTLRLFRELTSELQIRLTLEEIILFTEEVVRDEGEVALFDIRVLYFLNRCRVLYPQELCLYWALQGSSTGMLSTLMAFITHHRELAREVFNSIPSNSYRVHACWWEGGGFPDFGKWEEMLIDRINKIMARRKE